MKNLMSGDSCELLGGLLYQHVRRSTLVKLIDNSSGVEQEESAHTTWSGD